MARLLICAALSVLIVPATVLLADVTLVDDGKAACVVVADGSVMAADAPLAGLKFPEAEVERQRQRLRESVRDLVLYLGRIGGTTIEIVTELPGPGDTRVPLLVGAPAVKAFGATTKSALYKQGFRYVATPKGVGMSGESDLAASYAVYELLDRLGCRWFMPSEMGEFIPTSKTITLTEADLSAAPGTHYRGVWYADDAFRRRNRHGGLPLSAGHALEFYFTKEDRAQHPEWQAEIGGKPDAHRLRWSNAGLANALADKLLALHAADPQPSYSLSPDDGGTWDESSEDRALDAGDVDPTFGQTAITDRLIVLSNRVAAKVAAKHPDVLFGLLAYVQYTRPPIRENVHRNIVPQLAPITYSRAHPMTDDRVPGNKDLRYLIDGWGKKTSMTSMYFYAWFLAEPSAPNPMLTKWGIDVPIVLANNCKFWQPETLPNFETSMHALYMGGRLAFDPSLKPDDVYADLNAKFYGHAAAAMTAYWKHIDDVWVNTPEYSGCGFGHLRRWTPEQMNKARQLLNAGMAAAQTPVERQRIQLADESLKLFELFMKLRRDQAEGRFDAIADEAAVYLKRVVDLGEQYKDQFCFTRVGWAPTGADGAYFAQFYQQTYNDAARVAKGFDILTKAPIRQFRYQAAADNQGEAAGWAKPEFDDKNWKTTDPCLETWSTLGYHDHFKSMWYRTEVTLPELKQGRRMNLWLGSFDGSVKVFVNGQHVKHIDVDGKSADEVTGYCQPFSFDITGVAKPGANVVALFCTRKEFNELGTGGLLAPLLVYADKP